MLVPQGRLVPPCALCIARRGAHSSKVLATRALRSRLEECAARPPHPFSLHQLLEASATRTALYHLLRAELPVRLAHLITALPHLLPGRIKEQRTGQFLQDYFEMSFREVEAFPTQVDTVAAGLESRWLEVLARVGIRLGGTTEMLAEAATTSGLLADTDQQEQLQRELPNILRQNLSVDVLVSCYRPPSSIHPANNLLGDVAAAYDDARYLCEQHYLSCPELEVNSNGINTTFTSVPSHNYLILFEIFKNALRATVERHGDENAAELPKVEVNVRAEGGLVMLEVKDEGGGMSADQLARASRFFASSAELGGMSLYQGAHSSPLAGHGFGLGVCAVYCAYWGGGLAMEAREGRGTSVTLAWRTDPRQARENVY